MHAYRRRCRTAVRCRAGAAVARWLWDTTSSDLRPSSWAPPRQELAHELGAPDQSFTGIALELVRIALCSPPRLLLIANRSADRIGRRAQLGTAGTVLPAKPLAIYSDINHVRLSPCVAFNVWRSGGRGSLEGRKSTTAVALLADACGAQAALAAGVLGRGTGRLIPIARRKERTSRAILIAR